MSICVVGSIAFDSVKTPFGECPQALGGAANYFSMSSSFFTKVQLVGVVGEDFPKEHLRYLATRNVDVAGVRQISGKTFHWTGRYDYNLSEAQTLKTELNVFSDFNPNLPDHYRNAQTVFCANIDPTLQLNVLEQVKSPKIKALDTMNFWIEGKNAELKKAVSKVDILFINEAEVRQLAREHNVVKAAKKMQELGPHTVVVKRGEYGSVLFHRNESVVVPAVLLEDVFDPTGAGDSFAGGFLGWLDKTGKSDFTTMKQAMLMGTVMSSFVIQNFSFDRLRTLTMQDIENRYKALRDDSHLPEMLAV